MLLFIKEILPSLLFDFILILICIGATVGCFWFVYMSVDSVIEMRRQRKEEKEKRERIERIVRDGDT